ncbi:hypothetical protein BHE74_00046852 [Ensete ventricosum]|nr:hypothetical protein BHE74_00046852 [Ensete ventricosum]
MPQGLAASRGGDRLQPRTHAEAALAGIVPAGGSLASRSAPAHKGSACGHSAHKRAACRSSRHARQGQPPPAYIIAACARATTGWNGQGSGIRVLGER